MLVSKVTRNYQITLPQEVREKIKFKIGDRVRFVYKDGKVEILKIDNDILKRAAGLWKGNKETGLQFTKRLRSEWSHRP